MVIILYFRSEMGSKSTCESSLVVVEAERRQSLPLCAYRQTRYHHVYTTLSSYISVTVTRRDLGIHRGHLEPLPPRLHDLVQLHQCQDHQTWPWDTQRSPWTTTTTFTRPCPVTSQCQDHQTWPWDTQRSPWTTTTTSTRPRPVTSVSRSQDVTFGHTEVTLNHYHTTTSIRPSPVTSVSRLPDVNLGHTEVTLNHYHHFHTTLSSYISLYVVRRDPRRDEGRLDPLFDVRKYTHVIQITGNSSSAASYYRRFFLLFRGKPWHVLKNFKSTCMRKKPERLISHKFLFLVQLSCTY